MNTSPMLIACPTGGGSAMTSAKKVSLSSPLSRWCLSARSVCSVAITPAWPDARRASPPTGIPPLTAMTVKFIAKPAKSSVMPGIRRLAAANVSSSV
jgi:hypothetical protein